MAREAAEAIDGRNKERVDSGCGVTNGELSDLESL